jgi:hypothetical protein
VWLVATSIACFYDYIGMSWTQMLHVSTITGLDIGECPYAIGYNDFTADGLAEAPVGAILAINGLEVEAIYHNSWSTPVTTVYDPADAIVGNIRYNMFNVDFVFDGGANVDALAVGQPTSPLTWIEPTLTNGWSAVGTPISPVSFVKDGQGWVHLRGQLTGGTINDAAFTLPVGYRPGYKLQFPVLAGPTVISVLDVLPDGGVILEPLNSDTNFSTLDGIIFHADA